MSKELQKVVCRDIHYPEIPFICPDIDRLAREYIPSVSNDLQDNLYLVSHEGILHNEDNGEFDTFHVIDITTSDNEIIKIDRYFTYDTPDKSFTEIDKETYEKYKAERVDKEDQSMNLYESNRTFTNVNDAVQYLKNNAFIANIFIYDEDADIAHNKAESIYASIKEYNKGKPLNDQILPTTPYEFKDTVAGIEAHFCEIGCDTYARNHKCVPIFCGYNTSVLDTDKEKADVRPDDKAMRNIALLGYLAFYNN